MLHWSFAALGGVVCLVFVQSGPMAKVLLPLLLLPPQLVWLGYVVRCARRVHLGRW